MLRTCTNCDASPSKTCAFKVAAREVKFPRINDPATRVERKGSAALRSLAQIGPALSLVRERKRPIQWRLVGPWCCHCHTLWNSTHSSFGAQGRQFIFVNKPPARIYRARSLPESQPLRPQRWRRSRRRPAPTRRQRRTCSRSHRPASHRFGADFRPPFLLP